MMGFPSNLVSFGTCCHFRYSAAFEPFSAHAWEPIFGFELAQLLSASLLVSLKVVSTFKS
jgi:hypothetical protein